MEKKIGESRHMEIKNHFNCVRYFLFNTGIVLRNSLNFEIELNNGLKFIEPLWKIIYTNYSSYISFFLYRGFITRHVGYKNNRYLDKISI